MNKPFRAEIAERKDTQENLLSEEYRARLFKTHVQGAIVRSIASAAMWFFALFAFWFKDIQAVRFIDIGNT